jgi:hypothetical protein
MGRLIVRLAKMVSRRKFTMPFDKAGSPRCNIAAGRLFLPGFTFNAKHFFRR